ncbi:MAG: hypothetical protein HY898_29570 [Deltaproteobacteria bacterium]|nr:hypothetical protein [Deltaproteobacteria bacterium]
MLSHFSKTAALAVVLLVPSPAWAQTSTPVAPAAPPPSRAPAPANAAFSDQLVLDTGRTPFSRPTSDMHAEVHGEYQVRYYRKSDLPLTPPPGAPDAASLGQKNAVLHWMRITPRFYFTPKIYLAGQIDYPQGFIAGEETRFVGAASEPLNERGAFRVDPRWLYLDAATDYGHWRVGQQGSHWGMGILANDGNHPSLFGDYRKGAIVERVLLAANPGGKASLLTTAVAADLVFRDNQAELTNRDLAFQGVVMVVYGTDRNQLGLYGVAREQSRGAGSTVPSQPYTDRLSVRIADLHGRFTARVPGAPGYVFGQAEAVVAAGTTRYAQNPGAGPPSQPSSVRAWGGAFTLGTVHEAMREGVRWGDLVLSAEWGYASGDNDPLDGVQRRLTFDPNHKVGLVMFDHALSWMSARSAVNSDFALRGAYAPGLQFLPSNGGVSGAAYFYPTFVVRPRHWLDLKGAMLVAQTTADLLDPYRTATTGRRSNYLGGDPARRDLGVEFDLGAEARVALDYGLTLQLGAQGGVLFPGRAFDDNTGNGLKTQVVAVGRVGLQY